MVSSENKEKTIITNGNYLPGYTYILICSMYFEVCSDIYNIIFNLFTTQIFRSGESLVIIVRTINPVQNGTCIKSIPDLRDTCI